MKKYAFILFALLCVAPIYAQKVFIYGEKGEKIYFTPIDSLVLLKYKKNLTNATKIAIAKKINPNVTLGKAFAKDHQLIFINKRFFPNYEDLKRNDSIIYANQSLLNAEGDIQIPTEKV